MIHSIQAEATAIMKVLQKKPMMEPVAVLSEVRNAEPSKIISARSNPRA